VKTAPPRATIREVPPRARSGASIWRQERASFGYALQGVGYAWKTQRHLRIHVSLGLIVSALGLFLVITPGEWAALLTAMTLVIALELLNTVVEAAVDLASPRFHPKAKVAKDVAAGAVLVSAAGAILVGGAIFVPRLLALILR
jgi:diacylglycerol kinase (ATP)